MAETNWSTGRVLIGNFVGQGGNVIYTAPMYPSNEVYYFSGIFSNRITVSINPLVSSLGGFSFGVTSLVLNHNVTVKPSEGEECHSGLVSLVQEAITLDNLILPRGYSILPHGPFICEIFKEFYEPTPY